MSSNSTNPGPEPSPLPSPPTPPAVIPYYNHPREFPPFIMNTTNDFITSGSSGGSSSTYSRFFTVAVICLSVVSSMVLFLHLYLRYMRRQHIRHRRQTANLLRLTTFNLTHSDNSPRAGLDRSAISTIPSFQYQNEADNNTEHSTASAGSAECAVCLSSLVEGDVVRMLPACRHVFHVACIDKWLTSSASCPVCRAEVSPQTQVPGRVQSQSRSWSRSQSVVPEMTDAPAQEHSAAKEETEAGTSVSTRLSSSFQRILSSNRSSRRVQDDAMPVVEDLERGNGANSNN